jgi:hypothetical protein
MYKDIILHGLKVRVFGNGKSIQVFRNKSWVPLKFKESYGYPLVTLKHKSLRKHYKVSRLAPFLTKTIPNRFIALYPLKGMNLL